MTHFKLTEQMILSAIFVDFDYQVMEEKANWVPYFITYPVCLTVFDISNSVGQGLILGSPEVVGLVKSRLWKTLTSTLKL